MDIEARQAIMGLLVRIVDEFRLGIRDLDLDEIQTLAGIWRELNGGTTPSEISLLLMAKRR